MEKDPRLIDWAGTWFPMMERLGESTVMSFYRYGPEGLRERHVLKHTDYDGMGAMRLLLHGPGARNRPLEQTREKRPPHWLKILLAILRHAWMTFTHTVLWKGYDPRRVGRAPAVAWVSFDVADSGALKAYAASRKTSLNILLLLALERATRPRMIAGGRTRWSIPVNLRGATGLPEEVPNQFSLIDVICPPGMEVEDLHRRVVRKLKQGNHWANWALMHYGKHAGLKRAEEAFRNGYAKPRPGTGGISSVGEWDSERVAPDEAWVVFGPTSKLSPVSMATAAVNGKLAVTLQIHPSLGSTTESTAEHMEGWLKELRSLTGLACASARVRTEALEPVAADQGQLQARNA
jgi:hypothetical protein